MPIEVKTLAEWEMAGVKDLLSVVIPAHNEEGHIEHTVRSLCTALRAENITFEILVVNDNSQDKTEDILKNLCEEIAELRYVNNTPPNGFGFAVRMGLAEFRGDAVAIYMADSSDDPADLVKFYRKMQEGYDCVFGSRFVRGGQTVDYPLPKHVLNRMGNTFIKMLFMMKYNDITNAFKLYRRRVIAGLQPLLAYHFNLTVELPLKAIVRGYSYAVIPNSWYNRKEGVSKFRIKEMGSRYLFIIFYCLFEKLLSQQDYKHDSERQESQLQVWHR